MNTDAKYLLSVHRDLEVWLDQLVLLEQLDNLYVTVNVSDCYQPFTV